MCAENSCPICMKEQMEKTYTTKCNHKFCEECIDTWLEIRNTCPLCRCILKEEDIIEILVIDDYDNLNSDVDSDDDNDEQFNRITSILDFDRPYMYSRNPRTRVSLSIQENYGFSFNRENIIREYQQAEIRARREDEQNELRLLERNWRF